MSSSEQASPQHTSSSLASTGGDVITVDTMEDIDFNTHEDTTDPEQAPPARRRRSSTTAVKRRSSLSSSLPPMQQARFARLTAVLMGFLVLIVVIVGFLYFIQSNDYKVKRSTPTANPNFRGNVTLDELAEHNDPRLNCWLGLHGKVYDLTTYAQEHPGGPDFIWDSCGQDATASFNAVHPTSLLTVIEAHNLGNLIVSDEDDDDDDAPGDDVISMEQLAAHTTAADCWVGLRGDVYDLTSYISQHPGGPDYITNQCGLDATTTFDQHHDPLILTIVASQTVGKQPEEDPRINDGSCDQPVLSESEVAAHAVQDDCWMVLYHLVFDLTDYLDTHPGGKVLIARQCGQADATATYELFTRHDETLLQTEAMNRFLIGKLSSRKTGSCLGSTPAPAPPASSDTCDQPILSSTDVALHADRDDCWMILYSLVFDLTDYIDIHPGGNILMADACGGEATATFELFTRHDEALLQSEKMDRFLIGKLSSRRTGPCLAPTTTAPVTTAPTSTPATCDQPVFFSSDVAVHATKEDCWMILYDLVFDLTDYIEIHPGGNRLIANECGRDATDIYELFTRHHEALLETEQMNRFLIGKLSSRTGPCLPPALTLAPVAAPTPATCNQPILSVSDIAVHTAREDCWMILYDLVFDLTDYIEIHPGGSRLIANECGRDATDIYELFTRHDEALLEAEKMGRFLIGKLSSRSGPCSASTLTRPPTRAPVAKPAPNPTSSPSLSPQVGSCNQPVLSFSDVAGHDSWEDCWMILYNLIYDLTDYIDTHPGGNRLIANECGRDATDVYELFTRHDETLLSTEKMDRFLIGKLSSRTGSCSDPSPTTCQQPVIASTDVALHSTREDCWMILYDLVFELTEYIEIHPGGNRLIANECGREATNIYELFTRHDEALLETEKMDRFLIGKLATRAGPCSAPAEPATCEQPILLSTDVAQHARREDCWMILYDLVFDLTEYIEIHPGGNRLITNECGRDATDIYELFTRHNEALLETEKMARFLIGKLSSRKGPCKGTNQDVSPTSAPIAKPVVTRSPTQTPVTPTSSPTKPESPQAGLCTQPTLSSTDVAMHATREDCWMILYDLVFNLTDYIETHPGGNRLISNECGRDATDIYELFTRHDEALLTTEKMDRFLIGKLEQRTAPCGPVEVPVRTPTASLATIYPTSNTVEISCDQPLLSSSTVAVHSSRQDCWIVVDDLVYDMTDYISSDPGGALRIYNKCGRDATAVFDTSAFEDADRSLVGRLSSQTGPC